MDNTHPTNGVTVVDHRHELRIVWYGTGHGIHAYRHGKELAFWNAGNFELAHATPQEVIESIRNTIGGEFPYWNDPDDIVDHGEDRAKWPRSSKEWKVAVEGCTATKLPKGFSLTTNHPQSSYGIPVLVDSRGTAYGAKDLMPDGANNGEDYVWPMIFDFEISQEQRDMAKLFLGLPIVRENASRWREIF